MARIAGVTLPANKPLIIGLTYIYGVGETRAKLIVKKVGIDPMVRIKDLTLDQENAVRTIVEKDYRVEGELRRDVLSSIKRLREIASYRGSRHAKRLPARGQRTKTNSRTVRGNVRKTAGSGRRILTKT
jgi:small subunit ribosomal protein S13